LIPINDPAAALAEPAAIVCALDKAERPRRREACGRNGHRRLPS